MAYAVSELRSRGATPGPAVAKQRGEIQQQQEEQYDEIKDAGSPIFVGIEGGKTSLIVYKGGTLARTADALLACFAIPCTVLLLYFGGVPVFWALTICAAAIYTADAIGAFGWSLAFLWGTGA